MTNLLSSAFMTLGIILVISGVLDRYFYRAVYHAFFAGWCTGLIVFNLLIFLVEL